MYKVIFGWGGFIGFCSDFVECIYYCKLLWDNLDSDIKVLKLFLFKCKVLVLFMFSDLKCKGFSFVVGKFDMSNLRVDVIFFIVGCGYCNRFW